MIFIDHLLDTGRLPRALRRPNKTSLSGRSPHPGVASFLFPNGRRGAVTGKDAGLIRKAVELLANPSNQKILIASREIATADTTRHEHVAGKKNPLLRPGKRNAVQRMSGNVRDLEGEADFGNLEPFAVAHRAVHVIGRHFEGTSETGKHVLQGQVGIRLREGVKATVVLFSNRCRIEHVIEVGMRQKERFEPNFPRGQPGGRTLRGIDKKRPFRTLAEKGIGGGDATRKDLDLSHLGNSGLKDGLLRPARGKFASPFGKTHPSRSMSLRFKSTLLKGLLPILLFTSAVGPVTTARSETNFGDVAMSVALLLRNRHYTRTPFDDKISQRMLDNYLEFLDYNRVYFTQEDIDEFTKNYAQSLDDIIFDEVDIEPARVMHARRLKRVEDRVAKIKQELNNGAFTFETDREVLQSRKDASWPEDEAAADRLWHDILEAELLQEQLRLEAPEEEAALDENGEEEDEEGTPRERILQRYERFLESLRQDSDEDIANLFLTAMATAYDPHSEYFSQSELDSFQANMKKRLQGIGALLSMVDGLAEIKGIVVGGPADKAGNLQVGDKILAVAEGKEGGEWIDITYMKLQKVVDMIRGEEGTTVRLKIIPADAKDPSQTREIRIVREEVQLKDKLATAELIETRDEHGEDRRIGWIYLPSFYADMEGGSTSMTADVLRLLTRLQQEKIDGLIVDVRGNGGGSLEEAIKMTGLFINRGPVVQSKDYKAQVDPRFSRRREPVYDGPLMVLTDRISASASEILAAALQDYNRAIIVGGRTFGKGTVQTILPVARELAFFADKSRAGALKVTIQKFYRISGGSTQEHGVIPDIPLPSIYDVLEKGEASLKFPMKYDEIDKLAYKPMNDPMAFPIAELKMRSAQRLSEDKDYQYLLDDMARLKEQLDENTISLNIDERRRENAESRQREDAREEERRSRYATMAKELDETTKVYKLTLDNVDQPGLTLASDFTDEENTGFRIAENDLAEDDGPEYPMGLDPFKHETLRAMSDFLALRATPNTAAIDPKAEGPVKN